MVDVIGIGALNWDRLFKVDRFASSGEEIVIQGYTEEAGGSAANTVAGLGKMGVPCGFVGRVGDDEEGGRIVSAFRDAGVDTSRLKVFDGRSGIVLVFIDASGERTMYVDPGVNDALSISDIPSDYVSSADFVHISSFAGVTSLKTVKLLMSSETGADFTFAPGFLSRRGLDFLKPYVENCAVLFLNEDESRTLTGHKPANAADILRSMGVETVAITLGREGCLVADHHDGVQRFKAYESNVVDSTGAGDAFAAGFLYGLSNGMEHGLCAQIGNYAASRCIQKIGARAGLPDVREIEEFLAKIR